MVNVFHRKLE